MGVDTDFMPLAGTRSRRGHWADRPAVDPRVSPAEQEDQMPATDSVVLPAWLVCLGLALAPLTVIGAVSLVALLTR